MNAFDAQACRHESLHCAAAYEYGWRLNGVLRTRRHGESNQEPGLDRVQMGVVALIPWLANPREDGCKSDVAKVMGIVDSGVALSDIWTEADRLLADPRYQRRARAIEAMLYSHTALSGEECELLMAAADEGNE